MNEEYEYKLQERDINGHGKRRRKRQPSHQRVYIRHSDGSVGPGPCYDGNTYHVSPRNEGRKPKKKHK